MKTSTNRVATTAAISVILATSATGGAQAHVHRHRKAAAVVALPAPNPLASILGGLFGAATVAPQTPAARPATLRSTSRRTLEAATRTTETVHVAGAQYGMASYYGGGGRTASGGRVGAATCAHRSLPFGTQVEVVNLANNRRHILTVNDRGPFVRGRIIDVSRSAAATLGMLGTGVARVRVAVLGR